MAQIKKLSLAVASLCLLGAGAANAVDIQAGDWKLSIGGNVNGFLSSDNCESNPKTIVLNNGTTKGALGGLACSGSSVVGIQNGLLPNELSVTASSRQDDLDVSATISLWPTINTTAAGQTGSSGLNSRQGFFTFGDKSWGSVKIGRDLGIFGSDAILSDMTLLSVGGYSSNNGTYGGPTTFGRIGSGYLYADWIPQISYSTPNLSGFSATVGVLQGLADSSAAGYTALKQPGFQGKASYDFSGGGAAGKVWVGFLTQKLDSTSAGTSGFDANAYEIGTKIGISDFEGVLYYYDGDGVGTTLLFNGGDDGQGSKRKSSGGYLQGTYKIGKVKLGLSYGESKVDRLATDPTDGTGLDKNTSAIASIYYSLTKSVTLVGEYINFKSKNQAGGENTQDTFAVGGIIFF